MSFGICRVQKCGSAHAVVGLQKHNLRENERSGTNPDIRFSDSKYNYYLSGAPDDSKLPFNARIDKMLDERYTGKKAIRKDAVRLCDVIFTSDTAFFDRLTTERQREFFEDCFKFAANRYGAENIISAVVHMDEKTPHMHLDFVPLTSDGRLSAKSVLGEKKGLQELQDAFYATVCQKYNLERGERSDIDSRDSENKPRRHKSTDELKRETAYKAFAEASKDFSPIKSKKSLFRRDEVSVPITEYERMNAAILGAQVAEESAKSDKLAVEKELKRRSEKMESKIKAEADKKMAEAEDMVAKANLKEAKNEARTKELQLKEADYIIRSSKLEEREKEAEEKNIKYDKLLQTEESIKNHEIKDNLDTMKILFEEANFQLSERDIAFYEINNLIGVHLDDTNDSSMTVNEVKKLVRSAQTKSEALSEAQTQISDLSTENSQLKEQVKKYQNEIFERQERERREAAKKKSKSWER
jgi:hypothetical protein